MLRFLKFQSNCSNKEAAYIADNKKMHSHRNLAGKRLLKKTGSFYHITERIITRLLLPSLTVPAQRKLAAR